MGPIWAHIGPFRAFVECDLDEKSIPDSFATLPTLKRQVKDRKKTRKDQKITITIIIIIRQIKKLLDYLIMTPVSCAA